MKTTYVFAALLVLVAAATLGDAQCRHCPSYYQPVCGVNGVSYGNHCYLSCYNVPMAHIGVCSGAYPGSIGYRPRPYTPVVG